MCLSVKVNTHQGKGLISTSFLSERSQMPVVCAKKKQSKAEILMNTIIKMKREKRTYVEIVIYEQYTLKIVVNKLAT